MNNYMYIDSINVVINNIFVCIEGSAYIVCSFLRISELYYDTRIYTKAKSLTMSS